MILNLSGKIFAKGAFGKFKDTSGTWCATSHLSVFALLRPGTFLETLQRDGSWVLVVSIWPWVKSVVP